ncbi:protein LAZ1 [Tanacetum coccineum]|uniref:Protein LAZ1 n=1 Tax=Tanacetum coccineum TaxID=301880 RepID=A0ABQ5CJN3_9ASTR
MNDYRPISCCNIIYKCISKLITNRLKEGLDDVVSKNQSAFIPSRSISDNILLTQELMHNYHLNKGPPRYAFKVDIQKAYDTVDWRFLKGILIGFGFHTTMVSWIMACVSSTSFSLCINGELHGYFKDDLILFARGKFNSAKVIMESLQEFKEVSGLILSIPKSTTFFCNVASHVKSSILQMMSFEAGILPIKYLGIPLISSRILYKDCKILVEWVSKSH